MPDRRKKIAVIAADAFNDYMNRIFVGISEQCRNLGYDAYVFMMAFNMSDDSLIQKGEENIFSLIKNDSVDGIILMAGNFASQKLIEKFEMTFSAYDIPVISIDYDFNFCESIYAEDSQPIEMITDHFIEHHGCKRIMCLTGPEGNTPAMSRLNGYRASMKKHGLEVRDEDIVYGDFWKITSRKLADEFISGVRELPEAIVCANDLMAMHLCNALIKGGIRVPDDVKISGYDGSHEAMENIPSLTTIYPCNDYLGASAVVKLHKLITGDNAEVTALYRKSLILAQSCGCSESLEYLVNKREDYHQNVEKYEDYFKRSGMLESLMEAETIEELLNKISAFTYILNGIDTYMLCLCRNYDGSESDGRYEYLKEGYGKDIDVRLIYHSGIHEYVNKAFTSDEIIPRFMDEYSPEPSMYFMLPVHFMDRCFGYSIFKFGDIRRTVSMVFAHWNRNVSISIEFLRVRNELMAMNRKISMTSIRDSLTGIYNRSGFNRFSQELLDKARAEKKRLLIIVADLDKLKLINDNFGHVEGDNAIATAATALNSCCINNEICARIGGDEYAIVGVGDYTDDIVDSYYNYILNYLERYNDSSGKGYKVGLSLGFFCDVPLGKSDFSAYFKIADNRMYENKFDRKKIQD